MLKLLAAAGLTLIASATIAAAQPVWRHYPPPGAFPAPPPRTLPTPPEILRTYDAATGTATASMTMLTLLPDVGPDALSPFAPAATGTPGLEPIEAMPAASADAASPPSPLTAADSDPVTTAAITASAADPSPAPSSAVIALPPAFAAPAPAPAVSVPDPTPSPSDSADTAAATPSPAPPSAIVPTTSPARGPSAGGSGLPVLPGALAAIVLLAGALVLIGRRRAARG